MVTLLSSSSLGPLVKRRGPPNVIILLLGAVLALSFLDTCDGAVNTTNKEAKSMEKGMQFLFQMTTGFLQLIQPNRIYEKYDLNKLINDNTYREESLNNWQQTTLYLIGFAVCGAIGIVFIIVMPIIGCCMCCCRTCCGKCGGKMRKHDPKNARYKRGCYATFLTIFNTFILFAVVCTFVTNELLKKRFVDDPEIFNTAKTGTKDIIRYVDTSFTDLKTVAAKQVSKLETELLTQLQNAGNRTVTKLAKTINVTQVLDQVEDLGDRVVKLSDSLSDLNSTLSNLVLTGDKLKGELKTVKDSVVAKLKSCNKAECNQIRDYIKTTDVGAKFNNLDKQDALLAKLKDYLVIPNLVKEAEKRFNSVSKNVTDVIEKQNKTIADSFTKVSKELDKSMNFSAIKDQIPTKAIDDGLDDALKMYKSNQTYQKIPWYVGLCVASILLLIVVCNYMGILFGLCGERAGENTPCCNRGVAANFLLAGVGFYFIFCWILVLLVLIEFFVGGLLYTEVCRYLNPKHPQQLKPILSNFNYSVKILNGNVDLRTYEIVDKCSKNYSILNSLGFPKKLIEDQIPKKDLYDKIRDIDKNQITLGKIQLVDPDLDNKLNGLKGLDSTVNLTGYETQLNKTVVTTDLNAIANNLTQLESTSGQTFKTESDDLKRIQSSTVADMSKEMKNLAGILNVVKKNMDLSKSIDALNSSILEVQNNIQNNGNAKIKKIVGEEIESMIKIIGNNLDQLITRVINDVGPCRPLYDIFFTFTDILCVTFLNPMNGFWFSTGWAIFFFLPTIIFATKLARLYRCWYKRDPNQEMNGDSFTAGDADNIPLARVHQGKPSPQGLPNSAYDEIPVNNHNKYHPPPPNHHLHQYSYGPGQQQQQHYSAYPVYPPPSYHDTRMNHGRY